MNFQRDLKRFFVELLISFEEDFANEWPLTDPIRQDVTAVFSLEPRFHTMEESHVINGPNISIDRIPVQRGARQSRGPDADRLFFDTVIAANHNGIDNVDRLLRLSQFECVAFRFVRFDHFCLGCVTVFDSLFFKQRLGFKFIHFKDIVRKGVGNILFREFGVVSRGRGCNPQEPGAKE